ncbi:MAG: hypothetical protein C9356_20125 [Oleiphilus sp.]|nr:MAG: hypothetical protein C9356_20125 [Oleiphilus sp.]
MVEIVYPRVKEISSLDKEPLSEYLKCLSKDVIDNVPMDVIEQWIYRHSDGGFEEWITLKPHTWSYDLVSFSNDMILDIDHVGSWMDELRNEGREYVTGKPRSELYIGKYMLDEGTFPAPIIVAHQCGDIVHPRMPGEVKMKSPFQLIEGHKRLACLLGMIESCHENLKDEHKVWLVTINQD